MTGPAPVITSRWHSLGRTPESADGTLVTLSRLRSSCSGGIDGRRVAEYRAIETWRQRSQYRIGQSSQGAQRVIYRTPVFN